MREKSLRIFNLLKSISFVRDFNAYRRSGAATMRFAWMMSASLTLFKGEIRQIGVHRSPGWVSSGMTANARSPSSAINSACFHFRLITLLL